MNILFITGWLLIGFIFTVLSKKIIKQNFKIGSFVWIFAGPVMIGVFVIEFCSSRNWLNKIVFKFEE